MLQREGAFSPPSTDNVGGERNLVERLAASVRPSPYASANPLQHSDNPSALVPDSCGIAAITGVPPALRMRKNAPPGRAFAVQPRVTELTSLFTKLRLPNRRTRPPLRTVITLALRK